METSFEETLLELENIVEKLENGQLPLDESLVLFERGIKLARECEIQLKNAQQRVEMLKQEDNELRPELFEIKENSTLEK
ncbi:MAG: exodeoxyribonuclease VII small subunit [Candidatus Methanoperedens sp.]|nr:exodeoxyribonuclease VII small subunit [Candidatus Methanoperedens sp.]